MGEREKFKRERESIFESRLKKAKYPRNVSHVITQRIVDPVTARLNTVHFVETADDIRLSHSSKAPMNNGRVLALRPAGFEHPSCPGKKI